MPQPTDRQRPPGFLMALWFSFIGFIGSLFSKSPSAASLPIPVTASRLRPSTTTFARPTSGSVRATRVSPQKRPHSAAPSSTARTSPHVCRSRSATPHRSTECIFHPPPSPFPNISLSGLFATPPPRFASDLEHGRFSPPQVTPRSPSPFRASRASTPSCHTLHSRPPCTPSPSMMVRLDRSALSPTTMSDGSLEVISLGDRRGFVGSPVTLADIGRLPSPWSPVGKLASSDVWMSIDGLLTNATGPVGDNPTQSQDDLRISLSRISAASLYSSSSALSGLGISLFVSLDEMDDPGNNVDASTTFPKLNQVYDENHPTVVTPTSQTPRKRRGTIPCVTPPASTHSARAIKCLSTPLTKLDNVGVSHVRSATSISSMAYEFRMGFFADGRNLTALENIISLLDQASPESITPYEDAMQPVVVG